MLEQYEEVQQTFIIFGKSKYGKTRFKRDFCSVQETVHVFCNNSCVGSGHKVYNCNDLHLLNKLENFANSLIILDVMADNIRLPAVDTQNSIESHYNTNIVTSGHRITDLNTKTKVNTPVVRKTLNSYQLFIIRVEDKLKTYTNLSRFKYNDLGIIKHDMVDNYYSVTDKK